MSSLIRRRAYLAIMLTAVLVGLAVLTPSASALNSAAGPAPKSGVTVYSGDGAQFAGTYIDQKYDEPCWVYVSVGRSGTPAKPTTMLSASLGKWDPTAYPPCEEKECPPPDPSTPPTGACVWLGSTGEGPWGPDAVQIPNDSFTVTGRTYSLNATVDVRSWTCDWYEDRYECVASDPVSVPVSMTWQKTQDWESTHTGTDTRRSDGMMFRDSGNWSSFSADASGTVLGVSVTPNKAEYPWWWGGAPVSVDSYHQRTICRAPEGSDFCLGGK